MQDVAIRARDRIFNTNGTDTNGTSYSAAASEYSILVDPHPNSHSVIILISYLKLNFKIGFAELNVNMIAYYMNCVI